MTYDAERARIHTRNLLAVQHALADESALALAHVIQGDSRQQGAEWADLLDVLDDSDYLLEETEPMYEALHEVVNTPALIGLVTITLAWAWRRPATEAEVKDGIIVVEAYLAGQPS